MSYRREIIAMLAKQCDLKNTMILEIGSDAQLDGATILSEMGARLIIASNRGEAWSKAPAPPRTFIATGVDGRQLQIGSDSIDAVLGTAVLEHINDLPSAFAEFRRVLRPGGLLCLHGGPLWSCGKGHHVWVDIEGMSYRFNDDKINPVPLWAHLRYDEPGLLEVLVKEKSLPTSHAAAIAKWIFRTSDLNRVTYDAIIDAAGLSGFDIIEKKELTWHEPDDHVLDAIARHGHYGRGERFDVSDVRLVMRKTAEPHARHETEAA